MSDTRTMPTFIWLDDVLVGDVFHDGERWRARDCTGRVIVGHFPDRDSAIKAVALAIAKPEGNA